MKICFGDFVEYTNKNLLEFREGSEWDTNDWNDAYIYFKLWLNRIRYEYKEHRSPEQLFTEFAEEFF